MDELGDKNCCGCTWKEHEENSREVDVGRKNGKESAINEGQFGNVWKKVNKTILMPPLMRWET